MVPGAHGEAPAVSRRSKVCEVDKAQVESVADVVYRYVYEYVYVGPV